MLFSTESLLSLLKKQQLKCNPSIDVQFSLNQSRFIELARYLVYLFITEFNTLFTEGTMRLIGILAAGALLIGAGLAAAEEMHDHDMQMDGKNMGNMKHSPAMEQTAPVALRDEGTQKTCPVMGNPIDKNVYVDYQGKRIYFCCTSCPPTFKKDPEKYLKKMADNGEKPALLAMVPQKTCPVMGNPIDKKMFADYKGRRVYFCCGSCKATFKKDPETYLKKLDAMGEKPEDISK